MGKRTNTILQSAFFTLANVMPQEEAIQYMKDAATKSYLKKGQDVVDMNHRAIDAGATAFVQVEVPAAWADAADDADGAGACGPPRAGEAGPRDHGAGRPHGRRPPAGVRVRGARRRPVRAGCRRLREARRGRERARVGRRDVHPVQPLRLRVPARHHPPVRPHGGGGCRRPGRHEARRPPRARQRPAYQYTLAISPLDCMGCGVCIGQCPTDSLAMVPAESQLAEQDAFDYCVDQRGRQARAGRRHASRAASSSSRCWSSPAPAPAAPRRPTRSWSPSCSATACTSRTPRAARPSGAVPPPRRRTR